MGGSHQPYIYQPVTSTPFNPRAYTQSLANPTPRHPKPDGPLITFNRHPDSWDNLPYGKYASPQQTMSSGSKRRILWARKIQLVFRILQWLGALGLLICVIMIRGAPDTQGWVLRLPPAFDLAVGTYAVWHLCRSPTHHPPASAASYHIFALIMDLGLIPFYVFIAVLIKAQFQTAFGTVGRWRTMINNSETTNLIFHASWLGAIAIAGLHGLSLALDIFLVNRFRKIADMPPDMNPLEDNLTSRRGTKHKHKHSDTLALVSEDKRYSEISSRKSNQLSDEDALRQSQTSEKLMGDYRSSGISFFKSRDGHADLYSPHNPDTARQSWRIPEATIGKEIDAYQQSSLARSSNANLDRTQSITQYGHSRVYSPMPGVPRISKRHSTAVSPIAVYEEQGSEQKDENWEVIPHDGEEHRSVDSEDDFDPYRSHASRPETAEKKGASHYAPLTQDGESCGIGQKGLNAQQPLRMNPPTPEPFQRLPIGQVQPTSPLSKLSHGYQGDKENAHHDDTRTHTITSTCSSQYSNQEALSSQNEQTRAGTKARFFPDLAAAMRGVRHQQPTARAPQSVTGSVHTHLSASTADSSHKVVPATQGDRRLRPSGTVVRKPLKSYDESLLQQNGFTLGKASPSRVVSRTGTDVDVVDFAANGDLGLGKMRNGRRDVSGKVAEEGRGGLWRRISGRIPSR